MPRPARTRACGARHLILRHVSQSGPAHAHAHVCARLSSQLQSCETLCAEVELQRLPHDARRCNATSSSHRAAPAHAPRARAHTELRRLSQRPTRFRRRRLHRLHALPHGAAMALLSHVCLTSRLLSAPPRGPTVPTHGNAVPTHEHGVLMRGNGVRAGGNVMSTGGNAMSTRGNGISTHVYAVSTDAHAMSTCGNAISSRGHDVSSREYVISTCGNVISSWGDVLSVSR